MIDRLFKRNERNTQNNEPVNQAKQLKPGEKYNVVIVVNRDISYAGSYLTFDLALAKTYDVFTDYLSNQQAYDLEENFNYKQRKFDYSTNTLGISYDRSKNRIQAWGNAKEHIDVRVLVF